VADRLEGRRARGGEVDARVGVLVKLADEGAVPLWRLSSCGRRCLLRVVVSCFVVVVWGCVVVVFWAAERVGVVKSKPCAGAVLEREGVGVGGSGGAAAS
jgi:hypothetical protein